MCWPDEEAALIENCAESAIVGRRNRIPSKNQKYAFSKKSSKPLIPPYVSGRSKKNAYQKMTNPSGNQGEPLSFLTTFQAEIRIAAVMTNQRISPPMPISTTRVPNPPSTPTTGGFALKKRATYCPPSAVVPIP